MLVYLVVNNINKKIYVGKHNGKTVDKRWKFHCWSALVDGSKLPLHRAIRKYGVEAFSVSLLGRASTPDKLNELERKFIKELKANQKGVGYNMTAGGDGGLGFKWTPAMKKSLSEARMGEANPFFGKKHTPEARRKMGDPWRGRQQSEEHKRKRANAIRGKNNGNADGRAWQGREHSEDSKEKMSESALKSYQNDPGRLKVISEEMKTNWFNPKVAKKMLKGLEKARANSPVLQNGHKLSEETKRKISEAAKRRHAA